MISLKFLPAITYSFIIFGFNDANIIKILIYTKHFYNKIITLINFNSHEEIKKQEGSSLTLPVTNKKIFIMKSQIEKSVYIFP